MVVQPQIILEFDFPGSGLRSNLQAPHDLILEIEDVLLLDGRVVMVSLENLGDNLVVKVFIHQIEVESFGQWQVLRNHCHAGIGFQKFL